MANYSTEDFSFLIGMQLAQVAISKYCLQLNFHQGCQIAIEGKFELAQNGNSFVYDAQKESDYFQIARIIEEQIVDVVVDEEMSLIIEFNNKNKIKILPNISSACSIFFNGRAIIIEPD